MILLSSIRTLDDLAGSISREEEDLQILRFTQAKDPDNM